MKLNEIKEIIENGQWNFKSDVLWRGADLAISNHPIDSNSAYVWNDDRVVVTKYAEETSALVFAIRDACLSWYDYMSKYELFGRVGNALEMAEKEEKSLNEILLAMVDEAIKVEKEITWRPYFAYGSNMDEEQMKDRCPSAELIGKVLLKHYKFELDSEGVATIVPCSNSKVEGLLWRINEDDEQSLDRYEGVNYGCYRKETIELLHEGYIYNALAYISNRGKNTGIQRTGYMEKILHAAKEHSFSQEYIEELEKTYR